MQVNVKPFFVNYSFPWKFIYWIPNPCSAGPCKGRIKEILFGFSAFDSFLARLSQEPSSFMSFRATREWGGPRWVWWSVWSWSCIRSLGQNILIFQHRLVWIPWSWVCSFPSPPPLVVKEKLRTCPLFPVLPSPSANFHKDPHMWLCGGGKVWAIKSQLWVLFLVWLGPDSFPISCPLPVVFSGAPQEPCSVLCLSAHTQSTKPFSLNDSGGCEQAQIYHRWPALQLTLVRYLLPGSCNPFPSIPCTLPLPNQQT